MFIWEELLHDVPLYRKLKKRQMNIVYIAGSVIVLLWLIGGIYRHLRGRNKVVHAVENNCTGCKRCLKWCKHKVLEMVSDETGTHIAVKYPDKCTACGDCVSICKFNALEIVERK
jgi:NAD-dependent dihydropyrimidine dehydrogenase PreA subunit